MSVVQHRFPRLAIGIFVPGIVFAFITSGIVSVGIDLSPVPDGIGSLPGFVGLILSTWLFGGIQSIVYSVLMEFAINPIFSNDRFAVSISGLLIAFGTWIAIPGNWPFVVVLIGFLSGSIVGYSLRDMYKYYA